MVRLAEKRGEIGRQRIDEALPFGLVAAFEQIQILAEGFFLRFSQAARQPTVDHVLLGIGQRNPGVSMNQLANPLKIGRREDKFTRCRRTNGRQGDLRGFPF